LAVLNLFTGAVCLGAYALSSGNYDQPDYSLGDYRINPTTLAGWSCTKIIALNGVGLWYDTDC